MKKLMLVLALLAIGSAAQAAMTAEWSFENNLTDTATGGVVADTLVGMRYYPGNGKFDGSVTNYKTDGTTEVLTTGVQAPTYEAGISGSAVRIGARGIYNYYGGNVYPSAGTYQVPEVGAGATYLTTTADSADLSQSGGLFTMEAFIKADAVGGIGGLGEFSLTRVLTKWVSGFSQSVHFAFNITGGVQKLDIIEKNSMNGTVRYQSSAITVAADEWYYIAVTGDGDNLNMYFYAKDINGNVIGGLVGTGVYDGTMQDSSDPFWVGGRLDIPNPVAPGTNNGFIGLVDEVRVWDEAKDTAYLLERAEMIPEPATMAILALGGLLIRRKK